jgi:MarR family transcriptional regulator, organic hydroperoxide resistance regulator
MNTEFNVPEKSPGFVLWQMSNKWQAEQRNRLKPFNLTHVQFVLLACLVWDNGRTVFTQKKLAEYAKIDVMMTSQVLRALEQKGLIVRSRDQLDKRSITLSPTPIGIKIANKSLEAVEDVDRHFFNALGSDSSYFIEMITRLAK